MSSRTREFRKKQTASPRRKAAVPPRRQPRKSAVVEKNSVKIKRCNSEPIIWRPEIPGGDHRKVRSQAAAPVETLFRPQTCNDIFVSQDYVLSLSPPKTYQDDAKVVVSVTVEGSPGPIRAMVKLSYTVEEAIRVVVHKYNAEGRTPPLKLRNYRGDDDDDASHFELYSSYFSLQNLDKSDVIGDIGSRNFYLRKRSCKGDVLPTTTDLDTISNDKANTCLPVFATFTFLPGLNISWKINVMRRTSKLWRILGCLTSG